MNLIRPTSHLANGPHGRMQHDRITRSYTEGSKPISELLS
jgi:hypothetical protein